MKAGINAFLTESTSDLYPFLGVLVTLADGTVAYYSHSPFSTYAAFSTKTPRAIKENQNTTLSNLTALLSNDGIGFEKKYSTIHEQDRVYYATRMGSSAQHALGVVRVSVNSKKNDGSRGEGDMGNGSSDPIEWTDEDIAYIMSQPDPPIDYRD